jgi:hypothetical protein
MPELDPYLHAKRDARRLARRVQHRVVDFGKTYVTLALLKSLGLAALAVVATALNAPVFAVPVVVVAIVALCVHAIYSTKTLKKQDREIACAWIDGKRVEQRNLEAKMAMDTVTLALMGERNAPRGMRNAPAELRSALAFHQHRLHQAEARAEAAEAVKEGTATSAQRRALKYFQRSDAAPPKGPAVEPIKRRRAAHAAEHATLEAEIKSLFTADSIAKAMETEEVKGARRTQRERQDAAQNAYQAARDRVRAGQEPTVASRGSVINLAFKPNGDRDVSVGTAPPTPEEIARGHVQEGG